MDDLRIYGDAISPDQESHFGGPFDEPSLIFDALVCTQVQSVFAENGSVTSMSNASANATCSTCKAGNISTNLLGC